MTIAGMTPYQIFWYFLLYAFLGWVLEVVYHAVTYGEVVNRGFLNGPVCPIYGVGVCEIFALGGLVYQGGVGESYGAVLFIGGTILATLVELIGGWALDKLFHARWWDYSKKPLNFHGYICLEFSRIWGLGITFVVRVLHPFLDDLIVARIPEKYGWPMLLFMGALFIADLAVTVATVRGLNKKLQALDEIRASMRAGSDSLSESLGEMSIKAAQRIGDEKVQMALARAELEEDRRALLEKLLTPRHFGANRMLRAFPDLSHREYMEVLERIQMRMDGLDPDQLEKPEKSEYNG